MTKCVLGDVAICHDNRRVPLSAAQRANRKGPYRYYGAQVVIDHIDDYLFDGEYLLIAEDGENLRSQKQDIANLARGKFWVNNHAHIIQTNDACDLRYLKYLLNLTDISGYVTGSAQPKLSQESMMGIRLSLPDISDQRKISAVLSAIEDKIALDRKRIATLEAMAKEIYDYWFVQFDFPDAHGRPYKSSGGAMAYNPDLKREIPKGWEVVKLSRMADFLFGYPFDSSRFNSNGEGRRIVRIRNVKDGYSNDFTTEEAPSEYIIRNGDLLIGMDGYFDMNIWVGGDAYLVQRSCRVKAKDGIYQGYVRRFIAPPIKQLEKTLLGATVAHLGKTHLDDIDIVVPPKDVRAFQMLNDLDASIVQQGLEVAKLSVLRDFLLPVLMNGQVRVG